MSAWLAWAYRLGDLGFEKFYSDAVWTQYTPGYLYYLWFIGKLGLVNELMIKVPIIIADMAAAILMWKVISKTNQRLANAAFFLYVLNPIAILDGSIWGQIDGLLSLFMFYSIYLLVEKRSGWVSWGAMAIALLLKPQAVAILPVLALVTIAREGWKRMMVGGLFAAFIVILGFMPFYPHNTLSGMSDLIHKMGQSYPYTSLYAMNIWTYVGTWVEDSKLYMGITYFAWGSILMATGYLLMILRYLKYFKNGKTIYLICGLACMLFYLFPTRVHERYMFPALIFLMTYAGEHKNKPMGIMLLLLSISYSLNLYLPYSTYEGLANPLKNIALENLIQQLAPFLSAIHLMIFGTLWLFPARDNTKEDVPILLTKRDSIKHGSDHNQAKNS
jgi:Gpi18-like mannosyltransferase